LKRRGFHRANFYEEVLAELLPLLRLIDTEEKLAAADAETIQQVADMLALASDSVSAEIMHREG
jgi:hypothetical protein